jgi:ABC-2 type transport system permease protein
MHNILAIWQREMKSYFVSPIAYVVLTIFLALYGWLFFGTFSQAAQYTMQMAMYGQAGEPMNFPALIIQYTMSSMAVIILFLAPMLTMGLFSEEKKRGTIEFMLTTPVKTFQLVAGKYLASLTFFAILFVAGIATFSPLFIYSQPEINPIISAHLGMFLYGAALLALGLFISTLTENQIIAVVISFGISLILWIIKVLNDFFSSPAMQEVIKYLSLLDHLDDFLKGVIVTSHIIYYVTFAFVGLFLAYRSLESMRWKG